MATPAPATDVTDVNDANDANDASHVPAADHVPAAAAADAQIDHGAALAYWNGISATDDGMLGGFGHISGIDLRGSAQFLAKLRRRNGHGTPLPLPLLRRAVDCGAGIGRVTRGLLLHVAQTVDVVEPVRRFVDCIRPGETVGGRGAVGSVFCCPLERWLPVAAVAGAATAAATTTTTTTTTGYDLIWNQWCLGHLTDDQLVAYLTRCTAALAPSTSSTATTAASDSYIVIKENMSTHEDGLDLFDDVDNSVTRTDAKFHALFDRVPRLRLVRTELQMGFPKELRLCPVRFYALRRA
ncbi:MAG: hypothetical protein M1826_000084 [Phylliscum demangeonii]|nr:MAG: hypothetical protein M1826_000084 [Phylliscum demangeonii]